MVFHYLVKNNSPETVHIFNSPRMPYLIQEENQFLRVLHAVNAPDPDIDYNFIEIPQTQPLEPGASYGGEVPLAEIVFSDHYSKSREATTLNGSCNITCTVGWLSEPLDSSSQQQVSISQLLDRQNLVQSESVTVDF